MILLPMCAPRVTRQMSGRYSHSRQTPLKHVLYDVPDCGVDALSQFWQCLWKWWDVNTVLDENPHRNKSHTVRSGDRGGQVQKVLSAATARPTHRPGRCSFRYSRTSLCQCGGVNVPLYLLDVSCGINQFSNMA